MPGWAAVQVFVANNSWAHPVGGVPGSISAAVVVRNFSSAGPFLAPAPVQLQGDGPTSTVTGVTLDGVTFGGAAVTQADMAITGNPAYAAPPALCAGCTLGIVGADWTPAQKCSLPTSYCKRGVGRGVGGGAHSGRGRGGTPTPSTNLSAAPVWDHY